MIVVYHHAVLLFILSASHRSNSKGRVDCIGLKASDDLFREWAAPKWWGPPQEPVCISAKLPISGTLQNEALYIYMHISGT